MRVISYVYGLLVFLVPEWTVVKTALCRWCSHWSPSHASLRASCRWRTPGWKCQWSLSGGSRRITWGLITCERCVVGPKCRTPHSRKRTGDFISEPTHIEGEDEVEDQEGWKGRWERQWRVQSGELKRGQNQQCAWSMDDVMRTTILSQCHVRHWNECVKHEKMWRVRVFCSQFPHCRQEPVKTMNSLATVVPKPDVDEFVGWVELVNWLLDHLFVCGRGSFWQRQNNLFLPSKDQLVLEFPCIDVGMSASFFVPSVGLASSFCAFRFVGTAGRLSRTCSL